MTIFRYLDQDDIDEMRAEEQAQQAEAQITMFELLRCFFFTQMIFKQTMFELLRWIIYPLNQTIQSAYSSKQY